MSSVQPDVDSAPFWRSQCGKLLVKHCLSCDARYHYPRPFCPFCMSSDTAWLEASGRGTVYSFSIARQKNADPYVIAFVTLEEGISLMTHIVDTPPEDVSIGMPVAVAFRDVDGRAVPLFAPLQPTT